MLDSMDIALLTALQRDSTQSAQQLSDRLNLSPSQISRRRQRLESEGYIRGYRAHIDPHMANLGVQAFVNVHFNRHQADHSHSFAALCTNAPEIVSAWTLTGEADYLLRVFTTDLAGLNHLIQSVLLKHPAVARVHSQIVMDQLKEDSPLPTLHINLRRKAR